MRCICAATCMQWTLTEHGAESLARLALLPGSLLSITQHVPQSGQQRTPSTNAHTMRMWAITFTPTPTWTLSLRVHKHGPQKGQQRTSPTNAYTVRTGVVAGCRRRAEGTPTA